MEDTQSNEHITRTLPEVIRSLLSVMVSDPDEIHVSHIVGADSVIYSVTVGQRDVGRVLGKHGSFIGALRKVIATVGHWQGKRVMIDVIEPERHMRQVTAQPAPKRVRSHEAASTLEEGGSR